MESLNAGDVDRISVDSFNDICIKHITDNKTDGKIETDTEIENKMPEENPEVSFMENITSDHNKMPEENAEVPFIENITSDHKPDNITNFSLLLSMSKDENPILDNNNHEIISNGNLTENDYVKSKNIVNFNNETFDSSEGCK